METKVIDTQGFSHAETSGGGVRTAEVDNKTYESKLVKNLYFAGEVLDIVGNREVLIFILLGLVGIWWGNH